MKRPHHPSGSDPDRDREHNSGQGRGRKFEHDKGNASHIEIEDRRFRGGLPPTPELYERAREQWNQLPGSVVRSPMDPVETGNPPAGSEAPPAESDEDDKQKESR
ncbi:MAG TPA: hypothetical protein VF283_05710 [Bryobacteraceae bacterium]